MNIWVKGKRKRMPLLAGTESLTARILGVEPHKIKSIVHQRSLPNDHKVGKS